MSVLHRKSACVVSVETNLLELTRRAQLESLRYHCALYACFPPHKDPLIAPVSAEELKKLARAWKLHERRNFWKLHTTRDQLVEALLEYARDNKIDLTLVLHKDQQIDPKSPKKFPDSPKSPKPSSFQGSPKRASISLSPGPFTRFKEMSLTQETVKLSQSARLTTNYFGKKNFETDDRVLGLMSRYSSGDTKVRIVKLGKIVNNWRENNFFMDNMFGNSVVQSIGASDFSAQALKNMKMRMLKQRTLAIHLANYSSHNPEEFTEFTRKDVEVFLAVADSDDTHTLSTCGIGLSNICSCEQVRRVIIDLNAIHKLTSLVPHFQTPNIQNASSLLFYYISCEREVEDRIFSGYFASLQANCVSSEFDTRQLALYTLNNLLPSMERHRICDLMLATFQMNKMILDDDSSTFNEVLDMIVNMSIYCNVHQIMMDCDVLEMLAHAASKAVAKSDPNIGIAIVKILDHLLYTNDLTQTLITQDFIPILIDIISISDPDIQKYAFRILAVTSLREEFNLKVFDSDVLHVICATVFNERLSTSAALDAARFMTKISSVESKSLVKRLLNDGIPSALAELCSPDYNASVRIVAIRGLQNMFVHKDVAINFVDSATDIIFNVLKETEEIAAAMCIYNLARFEACVNKLVHKRAHVTLLETMCIVKKPAAKSACLQALTLFSESSVCIDDLLEANLITSLYEMILSADKSTWDDVTKMLLSIVVNRADLSTNERNGIERILAHICKRNISTAQVIFQSMRIIAFISAGAKDFKALDPIIRLILSMTDSENVVESASIALYNFSCDPNCIMLILKDDYYLNLMIRMMRSSKPEIQVVIAETLRTMCSLKECVSLLLNGEITSDLIAIALLRTSSADVKVCCCQAFYNVFCNPTSRLKLLEGDLWWSMMRLGRAEANYTIQKTCADALFQLASEGSIYAEALRDFHILNFIKDVISDADEGLMSSYIQSLQFLMNEFYGALSAAEMCPTLEIVYHCLVSSKVNIVIFGSLRLLLKAASSCQSENEGDFLKFQIMSALTHSIDFWCTNDEALYNVSRTLAYLSTFFGFSKATSLTEIGEFLFKVYENSNDVRVLESLCQVFLHYVKNKTTSTIDLINLPVWHEVVKDSIFFENQDKSSTFARSMVISIYAEYFLAFQKSPDLVDSKVFDGLFRQPVVKKSKALRNIAHVISECIEDPELSMKLIDSGLISFLWEVLRMKADILDGESATHYHEFCSEVLRNLAQHKSIVSKLVLCKNLKSLLHACAGTTKRSILYNICCALYKTLPVNIPKERLPDAPEDSIIAGDICEVCSMICDKTTDSQVIHMAKYISGINLDKYNVDAGCDPDIVLSMFTEMNDKDTINIPNQLAAITSKRIDWILAVPFSVEMENEPSILFQSPNPANVVWEPVVIRSCKKLEGVACEINNPEPIVIDTFDVVDPWPLAQYHKILRQYPMSVLLKNDLPLEEDDEQEEDEDDDFQNDSNTKLMKEPICLTCDQRYAAFRCIGCNLSCCLYCGECMDKHNKNPDNGAHVVKDWSKDIANRTPEGEENERGDYDIPASLMTAFTIAEITFFRHHFMEIDKDHGGTIDAEELQELTVGLGKEISIEHARKLIADFDTDGSGDIGFVEFVRLMLSIRSGDGSTEDNELVTAIYKSRVKFARESMVRRGSVALSDAGRRSFQSVAGED